MEEEILKLREGNKTLETKLYKIANLYKELKSEKEALEKQLQSKIQELRNSEEQVNALEKKLDVNFRSKFTKDQTQEPTGDDPRLNSLQSQLSSMNNLVKNLRADNEDKNAQIKELSSAVHSLRSDLHVEHSKEQLNYKYLLERISNKTLDVQHINLAKEHSKLKANLLALEEKNEELAAENERLQRIMTIRKEQAGVGGVEAKPCSHCAAYDQMLDNYRKVSILLDTSASENRRMKFLVEKSKEDLESREFKLKQLNDQLKDSEAKALKFQMEVKGNESELQHLRDRLLECKEQISQMKFSKKIYPITYTYMGITYEGKMVMEKDQEGNYFFVLETKTSSRKFSFLDVEVLQAATDCLKVNLKKDNTEEEYFSNECQGILKDFELFRRKEIENTSFKDSLRDKVSARSGLSSRRMEKEMKKEEKILNNFFNF